MMADLPGGTVTFLFTDIEGSTQLLHRLGDSYGQVLEQHRQLLRAAFARYNGHEVDTQGDAFFVAFQRGGDAVAATVAAQRALHAHPWPQGEMVQVRMGLHTGEPQQSGGGYFGLDVHRGARVMAVGHGGQVLLSQTAHALAEEHLPEGVSLRDLGEHRLKDLIRTEHLYQLVIPDLPSDFPALKTLNNHPNNLPVQMTSFVGREPQLAAVKQLLSSTHLLTLTGSGGTGKTRLALQVGAEVLEEYADGVWLVELAPLTDPDLVPQAVASALSVREEPGQSIIQTLSKYLAAKKLLLLLDNCEHLLGTAAQLADALLRSCPGLRLLASSREGLGIAGEQIYRVPSLSIPNLRETPSLEALSQYEAVCLFMERAVAVSPTFALTTQNASALAQLCFRLDGIPLAIELAAARVKALSVEKLLERLDDRFRLLTGGSRTALPRQQTLRALIDWSYDLLSPSERALLRRLSVFAGGWTLEAAESVGAGEAVEEWEVLDLLAGLVDKSLVGYEEGAERYHLLETVRQYARDRLLESGTEEIAGVRERHLNCFLELAETAKAELNGPQTAPWLERLEGEHDNLRAALAWIKRPAETAPGSDTGLRLGAALFPFWMTRGYLSEGREHLSALLAGAGAEASRATRAKVLHAAGTLAWVQGNYAVARALLEESLALRREIGDKEGMASSLNTLGVMALPQGDLAAARALLEESLALGREIGDKQNVAISLFQLGNAALQQGDYVTARALHEESLALRREIRSKQNIAQSLNSLGVVALQQGDLAAARARCEESLALGREIGDKYGLTYTFNTLGVVTWEQGDYATARALWEESLALSREMGDKLVMASSLNNLGEMALHQGDLAAARGWGEESLALGREMGNKQSIAQSLNSLGAVAYKQSDYAAARALHQESLLLYRKMGHKWGIAFALEGYARVAAAQDAGSPAQADSPSPALECAARLWGTADALREAIGSPLPPADRAELDKAMAPVRAALGEPAFASAWDSGRAMSLEQAIEYALDETAAY